MVLFTGATGRRQQVRQIRIDYLGMSRIQGSEIATHESQPKARQRTDRVA
jgi:hypothetical protein